MPVEECIRSNSFNIYPSAIWQTKCSVAKMLKCIIGLKQLIYRMIWFTINGWKFSDLFDQSGRRKSNKVDTFHVSCGVCIVSQDIGYRIREKSMVAYVASNYVVNRYIS